MSINAADHDQGRFFKGPDVEQELKKLGKPKYNHTVKIVSEEKMKDGSVKLVVWPHQDKRGCVLSAKVNLRAFRKEYGDDTDDWIDAPYEMFTEPAFNPSTNSTGPSVRVRTLPKGKELKPAKKAKPGKKKAG